MMKLWAGRLPGNLNPVAAQLNDSLVFDQRLALADVQGSQAWAKALYHAGVISIDEEQAIQNGLLGIRSEFESGQFTFQESDEDIHTAVERRLIELAGAPGAKLHTGRSRNDQVATDFCLWVRDTACPLMVSGLLDLQKCLLKRAEDDFGVIMPGYTHFQQAQPVLLSHWWLSHLWAIERDRSRLAHVLEGTEQMPLGSGALAGTGFPVDRFLLAADLGFNEPTPNSLDAVSNRDFALEFLFWAALTGLHLSRLAEALILYSTAEYGFIKLADAYSTGSSLMPQKKNPDPLELVRAKSGVLTGKLTGLLAVLKGLPSAYDKDLQEDKIPVFEALDILGLTLPVMTGLIATLTVDAARMQAAIHPQVLATDIADYLVRRGVPFREAHQVVARAVTRAEELGLPLSSMPLVEWQSLHTAIEADINQCFDLDYSLAQRKAWGGTAPEAVRAQIAHARKRFVVL